MPRLAGIEIPNDKKISVSLTKIYGIGRIKAQEILKSAQVDSNTKTKDLTGQQLQNLAKVIDKTPTEGDLRAQIRENIQRLKRIGAYRGLRHIMNLPVRGQNTRTNARTRKGKRRTVGSMTKEMRAKLETPASK
jgi:small subunit ribosomal protein S13